MLTPESIVAKCHDELGQLNRMAKPYVNRDEGYSTDTRLVHWVLFYPIHDSYGAIVNSSAAVIQTLQNLLLQSPDAMVVIDSDQRGLFTRFCEQLNSVMSYGLPLGMLRDEYSDLQFSKQNFQILQQLALSLLPLYRFVHYYENGLQKLLEQPVSASDFQRAVLQSFSHVLPEDNFSKMVSELKQINSSLEKLCDQAYTDFKDCFQTYAILQGTVKRGVFAGFPSRPIRDIEDMASRLQQTRDIQDAYELSEACCKQFGKFHPVSVSAKQLLGCHQSPTTSYLREELECDAFYRFENYPPLRPLLARTLPSHAK